MRFPCPCGEADKFASANFRVGVWWSITPTAEFPEPEIPPPPRKGEAVTADAIQNRSSSIKMDSRCFFGCSESGECAAQPDLTQPADDLGEGKRRSGREHGVKRVRAQSGMPDNQHCRNQNRQV